jgi:hypothetical protein
VPTERRGKREAAVKRLVVILLGAIVALLFASTALADKPIKEPLPAPDLTLEDVCSFDVLVQATVNKEFIKTFSNGRQLITGAFRVRVTNLDSDASLDLNIPGPGVFVEHPDGSATLESHGPWLLWFFPDDLGPGSPGQLFVNNGNFVQTFHADGSITIDKQTGSQTDICAALA